MVAKSPAKQVLQPFYRVPGPKLTKPKRVFMHVIPSVQEEACVNKIQQGPDINITDLTDDCISLCTDELSTRRSALIDQRDLHLQLPLRNAPSVSQIEENRFLASQRNYMLSGASGPPSNTVELD